MKTCREFREQLAKWLDHLPFSSEVAGSILSKGLLNVNVTWTQSPYEDNKLISAECHWLPPPPPHPAPLRLRFDRVGGGTSQQ